jgi:uncharacterized protein (TIGR02001 family)
MKTCFKAVKGISRALLGGLLFAAAGAGAQGLASYALGSPAREQAGDTRDRAVNWTRLGSSLPSGLDVNLKNGLYLGAWSAGIRLNRIDASTDNALTDTSTDLYAGYRSELSKKLWVDVGVQRLGVPSNRLAQTPGLATVNPQEVYGAVTWGFFTAKYGRNINGTANPAGVLGGSALVASQYLDFSANFDLGNGYSLSPRLGRQDVGVVNPFGFTDYSLTLGKTFANGLSLSVTALGTQAGQSLYLAPGSEFSSRLGLAAGLKYAF